MADPTPEERVAEAMTSSPNGPWLTVSIAPSFAHTALNAVRDALASEDPAVVRAMAERVGLLTEERAATPTTVDAGDGAACLSEACVWWPEPHGHVRVVRTRWVTPWREVPDADA